MKYIIILLMLLFSSCGYQPIYLNNQLENFKFSRIELKDDIKISEQILKNLSVVEDFSKSNLPKLTLSSNYKIQETSKDARGNIKSYRSTISVNLKIIEDEEAINDKNFTVKFDYNNKSNNFELIAYQEKIKSQILEKIVEDIFLYLKTK